MSAQNIKNHSKKIWSYIKSKGQEWEGVAPLKNKKGYLKSDNKTKANILNKQFQSMLKKTSKNCPDKCYSPYPRMDEMKIEPR